jgi:hypothetical protein
MKKLILPFMFVLLIVMTASNNKHPVTPDTCISTEEQKLYNLIMEYRKKNKLPVIPLSRSLTYVAQQHCKDLQNNKPDLDSKCNAHSWSAKGKWSACCYTSDHKKAACMWDKPKELTSYTDTGFEIAAGSSKPEYGGGTFVMTAEEALKLWQGSVHHNDVIMNKEMWKDYKWNAIGIGIYKSFSVVWFGASPDTEKEPVVCK